MSNHPSSHTSTSTLTPEQAMAEFQARERERLAEKRALYLRYKQFLVDKEKELGETASGRTMTIFQLKSAAIEEWKKDTGLPVPDQVNVRAPKTKVDEFYSAVRNRMREILDLNPEMSTEDARRQAKMDVAKLDERSSLPPRALIGPDHISERITPAQKIYVLFMRQVSKEIAAQNPTLSKVEVQQAAQQKWRESKTRTGVRQKKMELEGTEQRVVKRETQENMQQAEAAQKTSALSSLQMEQILFQRRRMEEILNQDPDIERQAARIQVAEDWKQEKLRRVEEEVRTRRQFFSFVRQKEKELKGINPDTSPKERRQIAIDEWKVSSGKDGRFFFPLSRFTLDF
ncbi:hypothetical protein BT69DRAFT_381046 [Atractiella rhizophila]|nr:hypothetical protein BT69DRAFT_381046 [Atractiella rhizophila]